MDANNPRFRRTKLINLRFRTRNTANARKPAKTNAGFAIKGMQATRIAAAKDAALWDQEKFNWLVQSLVARINRTQGIPRRKRSV